MSAVEELIRIKDTKSNIANGKMLLFEMELFEEIAYKTLLHGPSHALDFALSRRYRTNLFEDEYNKTYAKWNHLLIATRNYLSTINTLPDRVKIPTRAINTLWVLKTRSPPLVGTEVR